jgi:hypothetical protein
MPPDHAPDGLETHRDRLAVRVRDGERKVSPLTADDPRLPTLMERWHGLELAYRYAVHQAPEEPSNRCLDCGELSPLGLTPCDRCLAEEAEAAA